ncbi:MAG TPA: RNA methyltransferase substrate-binding domain-containing protein, partial [Solirubrobacteraceae bacterium]
MIVYGRNPVCEALRGRRTVLQVWATKNAAREDWLLRSTVPVVVTVAEEVERRCGTAAHQGVCAEVSPYVYLDASSVL